MSINLAMLEQVLTMTTPCHRGSDSLIQLKCCRCVPYQAKYQAMPHAAALKEGPATAADYPSLTGAGMPDRCEEEDQLDNNKLAPHTITGAA